MKKAEEKQVNNEDLKTMNQDELVSFLVKLTQQNQELNIQNEILSSQLEEALNMIKLLKKTLFGSKSEKSKTLENQLKLNLFDEVENTADEEEVQEEQVIYKEVKVGRKSISEANPNLEVKVVRNDMDELLEEGYKVIGEKAKEELIYVPEQIFILKTLSNVYAKELADGSDDILTMHKGNDFLDKSIASIPLVSKVLTDKYVWAKPLYRIQDTFKNLGANISRQTMSNWAIATSNKYLEPMYNLMKKDLLAKDIINADETSVQVLKHQDGSTNKKSYMWVYRSNVYEPDIIIYDYQPGRKADYAIDFLQDFKGYLQSDGYRVYKNIENSIQVGCLAHGRRKIVEALEVMGKSRTQARKTGESLLKLIRKIFFVDKQLQHLDLPLKQERRLEKLKPLFEELHQQLTKASDILLPKSKLGEAITYNLNQFESFENIFKDPRLELTNNSAERVIKPFVIGRKNWLFSNTTKGAKSSAIIYSVLVSAKENGLKVEDYLNYVFKAMSEVAVDNWSNEFISTLLPHSDSLPDYLYNNQKQRQRR